VLVDIGMGIVNIIHGTGFLATSERLLVTVIPIFVTNLVATTFMGYKAWYRFHIGKRNLNLIL